MSREDGKLADPELTGELFEWLTKNLDVPFVLKKRPAYQVNVDGFALKTRLQLLNRDKKNLARFCLILGTLCGIAIGHGTADLWSWPW
jgi:hypothetical protein